MLLPLHLRHLHVRRRRHRQRCRERVAPNTACAATCDANSQYAFPGSTAGVCHADVAAEASSEFDGNATQLLSAPAPAPLVAGSAEKSASGSLFSCSSAVAAGSLRSTTSA